MKESSLMKYKLSKTSKSRLSSCDGRIQLVINEAIKTSPIDFGVAEGNRTLENQQKYYNEGKSKLDGINKKSKHQSNPSLAIDLYAYDKGAKWDKKSLTLLAGHILGTANRLNIKLIWGGDWVSFIDLPHFELKG